MSVGEKTKQWFEEIYGVSLEKASTSLDLRNRISDPLSSKCEISPSPSPHDGYGRGHVSFGVSVSAIDADEDTRRIMSYWR